MTRTATALGTGPFRGFFTPAATLFELDPPLEIADHDLRYLVVSSMPAEGQRAAITAAFATDEEGNLDGVFYMHHGTVLELDDAEDIPGALDLYGYTITELPAPIPAI